MTEFEVVSGKIRVTDPCYDRECPGTAVVPAKNGLWSVEEETKKFGCWGERVTRITATHPDHRERYSPLGNEDKNIGVDSGQAGFFCESVYPEGETGEYDDKKSFYGKCCEATEGMSGGVVMGKGYVSSSGFGDGEYELDVYGIGGKATRLVLTFVGEDDE